MGMHFGLIAAETSVEKLLVAFEEAWPQLEIIASQRNFADEAALHTWTAAHDQPPGSCEWSKENPGRSVYVIYQEGRWAVIFDPNFALAFDMDNLKSVSRTLGRVLSFVIQTTSGSAHFTCFDDGSVHRSIRHEDGETIVEGEPLPEEDGIDIAQYYMSETDSLMQAFGLTLLDTFPDNRIYSAICVVDHTDYGELLKKLRNAPPAGGASVKEDHKTSPLSTKPAPWWKFW